MMQTTFAGRTIAVCFSFYNEAMPIVFGTTNVDVPGLPRGQFGGAILACFVAVFRIFRIFFRNFYGIA